MRLPKLATFQLIGMSLFTLGVGLTLPIFLGKEFDWASRISEVFLFFCSTFIILFSAREIKEKRPSWIFSLSLISLLIAPPLIICVDMLVSTASPAWLIWLGDSLSPSAGLAFFLTGMAIPFMFKPRLQHHHRVRDALLLLAGVLGFIGFIDHFLQLEKLYPVAAYDRMPLASSIAIMLLSSSFWFLAQRFKSPNSISYDAHEKRITRRTVVVLTAVTTLAGIAGFTIVRDDFEKTISESMLLTASTNASALVNTVETSLSLPRSIIIRPSVVESLATLSNKPEDDKQADFLRKMAESFLAEGLSAAVFLSAEGRLLAAAGNIKKTDSVAFHRLNTKDDVAHLLWSDGYILHIENKVFEGGTVVGYLITEQALPLFGKILTNIHQYNASSDALICSRDGQTVYCDHSRYYSNSFRIPLLDKNGVTKMPASHAVQGQTGVKIVDDLRQIPVIAAYTPLSVLGIGMVIKTDLETMYAPLKRKFNFLIAVLIAAIGAGTVLLRFQVAPLLTQIATEQKRMQVILENSNDAFIALATDGLVTDWNAAAETMFGWARQEAIGRRLADLLIPPDQREAHEQGFARFMLTGKGPVVNRCIEVTGLHRQGFTMPLELSVTVYKSNDGYIATAFVRDISERKRAQVDLANSEKRLRAIANSLPAYIAQIDPQQRYVFVNTALAAMLGKNADDLIGRLIADERTEEHYNSILPYLTAVLGGQKVMFEGDILKDGENMHYQSSYIPNVDEHGHVESFYAMTIDLTERKRNEMLVAANEQRLRLITDNLPVLISYIDKNHCLQFCNGTFKEWLGVSPHHVQGKHFEEVVGKTLYQERLPYVEQALAGNRVDFEISSTALGRVRDLQTTYIPHQLPDGTVAGIYTITTDISAQKEIEKQLSQLARFDSLTGLPNRHQFGEKMQEVIFRGQRSGIPMALMFLDIDHFKSINDTLGHGAGDDVLKELARRLKASVRQSDTVARLAGDEFVVILEYVFSKGEAKVVGDKILETVAKHWTVAGQAKNITVSIGIALNETWLSTPEELLEVADEALYEAKREGRATYRLRIC